MPELPATVFDRFSQALASLGPFEPQPLLAVAVSGGADSLTLALLADRWVRAAGGQVLALVVDHGLRPASAAEAALTIRWLSENAIAARLLTITDLGPGSAVAARAREARYRALTRACSEAGCLHLLLGHHRADQVETVMIRALGNSRSAGLAAMPAIREMETVRLLRPLLAIDPAELRGFLQASGRAWIEDPSNRSPHALRARLRMAGPADFAVADAALEAGGARSRAELAAAEVLAERVTLRPEGFALLSPGRIAPDALAALLQAIAGARFPPAAAAVESLAAAPRAATLAGVRVSPAGRFGSGWLVTREPAAVAAPVSASEGTAWDGRFVLSGPTPSGATIGALGKDAPRFRCRRSLPAAILCTLPAIRCGNTLVAVPHLRYSTQDCAHSDLLFRPPQPVAGAPFRSAGFV